MRLRAQGHAPSGGSGETEPRARNPGHRHPERDAAHGTGAEARGARRRGAWNRERANVSRETFAAPFGRVARSQGSGAKAWGPAQGLAPRARGHARSEAKDARSGNPGTRGTREAGTGVVTRGAGVGGRRGLGRATGAGAQGNTVGVSSETPTGSGCAARRWGSGTKRGFFSRERTALHDRGVPSRCARTEEPDVSPARVQRCVAAEPSSPQLPSAEATAIMQS